MKKLSLTEEYKKETKIKNFVEEDLAKRGYGRYFKLNFVYDPYLKDFEYLVVCDGYNAYYYNVPTRAIFKIGEVVTGRKLEREKMYGSPFGGYYFLPTYQQDNSRIYPGSIPEFDRDELAEQICCSAPLLYLAHSWELFQKKVAKLKKEQKQKQEEE